MSSGNPYRLNRLLRYAGEESNIGWQYQDHVAEKDNCFYLSRFISQSAAAASNDNDLGGQVEDLVHSTTWFRRKILVDDGGDDAHRYKWYVWKMLRIWNTTCSNLIIFHRTLASAVMPSSGWHQPPCIKAAKFWCTMHSRSLILQVVALEMSGGWPIEYEETQGLYECY